MLFRSPSSLQKIGDGAFRGCTSLVSIDIPDSVTEIGNRAFECCYSLNKISLPSSLMEIGEYAFEYCNLEELNLPSSLHKIGKGAFKCCTLLNNIIIPDLVTEIEDETFFETGLLTISISKFIKKIGEDSFAKTKHVATITVDPENISYSDCNGCNCIVRVSTNSLICGCIHTKIPNTVSRIGKHAFWGIGHDGDLMIPKSVQIIEDEAFFQSSLESITIPDSVIKLGEGAFKESSIKSIIIPESIHELSESLFRSSLISHISLPNTIETIAAYAFQDSNITDITIPASVKYIDNMAFYNCESLNSILVDIQNEEYSDGNGHNCIIHRSSNTLVAGSNFTVIPSGIETIGEGAFTKRLIKCITIPNTVNNIGYRAFEHCQLLKEIVIPESVKEIGWEAFDCCYSLQSITLPSSFINNKHHSMFFMCGHLREIIVPKGYYDSFSKVESLYNLKQLLIEQ